MKKYNILTLILLATLIFSCTDTKNYFSINPKKLKSNYNLNDVLSVEIVNLENKQIDSVSYKLNDKKIGTSRGSKTFLYSLKFEKLGTKNLIASVYYEGKTQVDSASIEIVSGFEPKLLTYTLVNTYPHDTNSFTEGLEMYKDTMYESTGLNEKSFLKKYDYKTGKIYKQVNLDSIYFGEGITILKDKIYMLTWQNQIGFIYNSNSFAREKTFNFDKKIEGWGMTNDGTSIYQTDGTEKIWKMDPATQKMIDYINVYSGSTKIDSLNELSYIEGKLFANIWQKNAVAVINPQTGAVEGILNFADLDKKVTKLQNKDVLNGIAYNPKTKTIFITGKNWDKLFEIKVSGL
ncbi:MAG: glutaminyl-peptide cyclotransferase [Flavobacterium sp.]|nr:glutaminyl-peptide cyclotransferase [Flavobacterium sp.]